MREFWEQRYSERDLAYGAEANAFLSSQHRYIQPGMKVLAVGDGQGRNGVWLAERGAEVLSVDYSQAGLDRALALAKERDVALQTLCVDLFAWQWPQAAYDAVVAIFVHFPPDQRARMHRHMVDACKPGGVVVLEGFTLAQLEYQKRYHSGGPPAADLLFTGDMLRQDFQAAEILSLEETDCELREGAYHNGKAAVVRLVARRPA